MSILVSIVTTVFALIAILFLWYIAYPFLLRYTIDSRLPSSDLINASNGNNGQNGSNGQNSPNARHGVHGQAGTGTAAGAHGNNGAAGRQGYPGIAGNDGNPGEDGEAGDDGVPGFNIIPVREHLFEPDSKTVYYVNGVSLEDHNDTITAKSETNFNLEKSRISDRIDILIKDTADKTLFKNALDLVSSSLMTPDPDIHVLDTLDKFNNFLDALTTAYATSKATDESNKTAAKIAIDAANAVIASLRQKRDLDYRKLETTSYKLSVRFDYNEAARMANPPFTTRMQIILINLENHINDTYDQNIRDETILLAQETRIFNSTDPSVTPADKNSAAQKITNITNEINILKMIKEQIVLRNNDDKSLILERYDNGDSSGSNPNGLSLETYGTGANVQKTAINNAQTSVITSAEVRKQFIESFIVPYRNAN